MKPSRLGKEERVKQGGNVGKTPGKVGSSFLQLPFRSEHCSFLKLRVILGFLVQGQGNESNITLDKERT